MKPTPLPLLYHDHRLVAVNKPSGLSVVPGRGQTTCLLHQLSDQLDVPCAGKSDPRLRLVHRLDIGTSGVLLFALDIDTQRHLSHQFQNNRVRKQYLALCHGVPHETEGEIDARITTDRAAPDRMFIHDRGKPAMTAWKIEQAFRHYALIRCFPKTGKTHQIRVHMRHIGHPLAVDPLYSPPAAGREPGVFLSQFKRAYKPNASKPERALIDRLTLHAERIAFTLPDEQAIEIAAPLPKDFRAVLQQLSKWGV